MRSCPWNSTQGLAETDVDQVIAQWHFDAGRARKVVGAVNLNPA
jgi:hypothetical protein